MSAVMPFGDRLAASMAAHGPVCVGIDPHPGLLDAWGLERSPTGVLRFSQIVLEALGGCVGALKPQAAFFEEYGSGGVSALESLVSVCREVGTPCIVDAKRGDIGSTMSGYARAYLTDGSPLAGDAVTLSPYLGLGSLTPALEAALDSGRGAFVLALTSNPEGAALQHSVGSDGRSVAARIVDELSPWNTKCDATHMGSFGVVIGATVGTALDDLDIDLTTLAGPVLAPGVGAQGAGSEQVRAVFGASLPQVLASTSRAVLSAGPDADSLRSAYVRTVRDLGFDG
ncbi:orotidine-5'-phosphate decarboxylase [Schaalia sp. 19OD2882]|uniref:orotidine-5'-phosphate decarboxylase n=1 Tax=Schaalia sp. 19OD2882 TaxID=2794089 RepID=UPI001C1EE578|nr:orotidine-5'-phosphate decarboxylase [Schaalia sp. 19OD2882]QWW18701.1 orotidine-5'-phosphate decarboxylase [Schaalia sp. 19OD2882]